MSGFVQRTTVGPQNALTDVAGLRVGHAHDEAARTGTTVILGDAPMRAAVDVRGGAPGTTETDVLRPGNLVDAVDAIVLSGGSAFGLEAAAQVRTELAAAGRGFEAAGHWVPIVPGAILFDLANGGTAPDQASGGRGALYRRLGTQAYQAARDAALTPPSLSPLGTVGAGYGATTATVRGGLGTASVQFAGGETLAAMVAVNPFGSVTVPSPPHGTQHFWAAPFERDNEFGGLGPAPQYPDPADAPVTKATVARGQTTIAVIATDVPLLQGALHRLAVAAHDGFARAIVPAHTPFDGDLVFALSTGAQDGEVAPQDDPMCVAALSAAAADVMARAIARAVYHAAPVAGWDTPPTFRFGN